MSSLKIIIEPNPILRKKAAKIENSLDSNIQQLIPKLIETMKLDNGVGIAAPQVSKSIQLIVVNMKDQPLVLINPKIILKSIRKELGEEGCLSVPGVFGMVKRSKTVRVKALNQKGGKLFLKAKGMLARVLQHEIDHLLGILFIDKVVRYTKTISTTN